MTSALEQLGISDEKLEGLSNDQVADLVKFLRQAGLYGLSESTERNYIYTAIELAHTTGEDFGEIDGEDVENWLLTKQEASRSTLLARVKGFYKRINGNELPEFFEPIRVKARNKELPVESMDDLISREELQLLIDGCSTLRDRALLSLLYDSGARIGEIVGLKVKDLVFDEKGVKLILDGKTGQRLIRLLMPTCHSNIKAWLKAHRYGDKGEAWLFPRLRQSRETNEQSHISPERVRQLLNKLASKVGITKRIYPHLFRHSRGTELAQHMTDAQLKAHMGWKMGSKMVGRYVHLSARDLDDVYDRIGQNEEPDIESESSRGKLDQLEEHNQKLTQKVASLEEKLELLFDAYGQATGQVKME